MKSRSFRIVHYLLAGTLLFGAAGAFYGCAQVTVRKVPTPTQYVRWTDQMQAKADKMEGIRFYLPRPFVNVFESFPIRTDIYLANGMVSPDGKYVVVTSVTAESGLSRYIATDPRQVEIPTGFIFDKNQRSTDIKAQSASLGSALEAASGLGALKQLVPTGVTGTPPAQTQPPPPPPPPPAPPAEPTGLNKRKVTNDNGAFAYQPLRGNFDIVYLPDFEEQYVASSSPGLGKAMFAVNLGQGWSLQGFDSLVDNSDLNKRIFNLIDTSIRLAQAAASAATGFPLSLPGGAEPGIIRPQSKEAATSEIPGTPVTLKIVVVHYTAKGLYPVIKPRELQERALAQTAPTKGVLDLSGSASGVEWASTYDPTAIARAQKAIDNQTGSFTVPRYPYQYLSFNTFRYMAIEVVRPDSEPFKYQYDRTGTTGDTGDARTGEINKLLEDVMRMLRAPKQNTPNNSETPDENGDGSGSVPTNAQELLNKSIDEIKKSAALKISGYTIQELELKLDGKTVTPNVTLSHCGNDDKAFKASIQAAVTQAIGKPVQLRAAALTVVEPNLECPKDNTAEPKPASDSTQELLNTIAPSVQATINVAEYTITRLDLKLDDMKVTPTVTLSAKGNDDAAFSKTVTDAVTQAIKNNVQLRGAGLTVVTAALRNGG